MELSNITKETWKRLSPGLKQCLAELAMNGNSSLSNGMRTHIEKSHLAGVLETVNDVSDLNQVNN